MCAWIFSQILPSFVELALECGVKKISHSWTTSLIFSLSVHKLWEIFEYDELSRPISERRFSVKCCQIVKRGLDLCVLRVLDRGQSSWDCFLIIRSECVDDERDDNSP